MYFPEHNFYTRDFLIAPAVSIDSANGPKTVFFKPGVIPSFIKMFIPPLSPHDGVMKILPDTITATRMMLEATTVDGEKIQFPVGKERDRDVWNGMIRPYTYECQTTLEYNQFTGIMTIALEVTSWTGPPEIKDLKYVGVALAADLVSIYE